MSIRIAAVQSSNFDEVSAYLPSNYKIACVDGDTGEILIAGEDDHGWTLDGYVIPQLASGLIACKEVTGIFELKKTES